MQLKKLTVVLSLSLVCVSTPARAELAFFENGNSISIKGHRIDGDSVVLTLPDGGEMVSGSSSIVRFGPDAVPYAEPALAGMPASLPVAAPVATPVSMSTSDAPSYDDIINRASATHGVPADLVHAVIQVESGYDERAVSRTGAIGLMQLMPETARQFNVDNPYDPRQNVDGGVRYLKTLLDRFPLKLALAAYNAGEGAVRRFRGIPPYAETRGYVARILKLVRK
jgi:soluble lytic murein transglycosylase-like protein